MVSFGHQDRDARTNAGSSDEPDATATTAAARASQQQQHLRDPQQKKCTQDFRDTSTLCGPTVLPSRGATATGITRAENTARFHDQSPRAEKEPPRPSTTATPARETRISFDHGSDRGDYDRSGVGACDSVGVDVRVSVGGVGVGAAARARLYRGYCEQRGGEYDREYRRHGGKEALERIALLNDTFM